MPDADVATIPPTDASAAGSEKMRTMQRVSNVKYNSKLNNLLKLHLKCVY